MASKKWLISFFCSALLIALLIAGFNMLVDPFGVFGDRIFNWYSFDFTNNPRASKIAYLDKHYKEYDSYIIGSSGTSAYSVELLNKFTGAKFYNLFGYGADMYNVKMTAEYVIKNYKVKNLIVSVGVMDAYNYKKERESITRVSHAKVDKTSLAKFYTKYMFANPNYAISKITSYKNDTYLPQSFDVFRVDTGSYDKSARDVEPIGSLPQYLTNNKDFSEYKPTLTMLGNIDNCVKSVADIKTLCEQNGVKFTLIFAPMYSPYYKSFKADELAAFQTKLANVTDFWDFSVSSISMDPRYFYDITHFRNAVGSMAIKHMFGNPDKEYIPDGFGTYVTKNNVPDHVRRFYKEPKADNYTAEVPILVYHHLDSKIDSNSIPAERFEEHIKALHEDGYTGISFAQLIDYVKKGTSLPHKPIIITLDDGYLSNYELAYPILKKYNTKATIFVIGSSVGKDTYKDTKQPIIPHFSYQQATEMIQSGLIEIQSHSFDMHQSEKYEKGVARTSVLQFDGESEDEYIKIFRNDFQKSKTGIESATGTVVNAYAYPLGKGTLLTDALLSKMGIQVTLTTKIGRNTIIKGLPQSLFSLNRDSIGGSMSAQELLKMLAEKK